MDSGLLLALMQQAAQSTPPPADAASGWFSLTISAGDLGLLGAAVAAYARLNERLARLETMVEPMWDEWNRRSEVRRRG